jgi:4-amino-4-deoxy-L-arabinose transferase-like glycosyltransferase
MISPPETKSQQPREYILRLLAISAITVLAAVLRFTNLNSLGYANHYYTAAVVSMLKSWHNFIYVAAEPGGSVSVDKPPIGLWLQTLSAHFLGVNSLGILLPQIFAGILSVIVLYHLVRRSFGTSVGLLAALALAVTPVAVATDRNNTVDSILVLVLLLATWAFLRATETGRLRHLLLGIVLVGVGFNIKMLEAFLPLPALFALYFLGSAEGLQRKIGKLALVSFILVIVSFSWAVFVDLTPVDQRPYVGSSESNSELNLIFGYNGIDRLLSTMGRGGRVVSPSPGSPRTLPPNGKPPQPGAPGSSQNAPIGNGTPDGGPIGNLGKKGALRLVTGPLSKETSWLLPMAVFSLVWLTIRTHVRCPVTPRHQSAVLWGGWLLAAGIFFSAAGFLHEYYLITLAPPIAALAAIGLGLLWDLRTQQPKMSILLLLVVSGVTLLYQAAIARNFIRYISWWPWMVGLPVTGALILIAETRRKRSWLTAAGYICLAVALLVTPGVWSALTAQNPAPGFFLPSAYGGEAPGFKNLSSIQVDRALLTYLESHTQDIQYLMAVPSSMQGADYVIATGRPVLYVGGFNGSDTVVTADELAQMVSRDQLRYIYWGNGMGSQSSISAWSTSNCRAVQGFNSLYKCK